ncbi:ArsR/SmtB family transcription factor [Pelagovum pacificum]|uniref:Helix-turn-helix transcriptional regulator n=1 Tax=Pelagovum pacificum TaxID=2588711 RepID=A0A5C5GJB5_9RHOB|nr:metalloregulator ArsR/SmtB family transcription factor [Pelagovum pacificum]QQA43317.1 helix-turn-helix transcriptional regulator [Pelagovum pacificum]TNY33546.1 helix-turn-helix transcriptional regulator [Pelagovum pacificum]
MAKHDPSLDLVFTALGDPTRRAILAQLAAGPASVSDLAEPFEMAMPSLMGHLKRLEAAGLVTSTKDGRVRTCALAPDGYGPARDWLDEQRRLWSDRLDRFDSFVTQLAKEQDR